MLTREQARNNKDRLTDLGVEADIETYYPNAYFEDNLYLLRVKYDGTHLNTLSDVEKFVAGVKLGLELSVPFN